MKINKGDKVIYIDTESQLINKRLHSVKVEKVGIWDGDKVILNDKSKTTVYNKKWLIKVKHN